MKQTKISLETERPTVKGTAVGGQYISPGELFTTKAGIEAIRSLIDSIEANQSKPSQPSTTETNKQG